MKKYVFELFFKYVKFEILVKCNFNIVFFKLIQKESI